MLLFIMGELAERIGVTNSNTSHVIVYRFRHDSISGYRQIQIHLMLLFIKQAFRNVIIFRQIQIHLMLLFIDYAVSVLSDGREFKYISCYCLSAEMHNSILCNQIQIHLMLLFIM